jgi:hypothetical protein
MVKNTKSPNCWVLVWSLLFNMCASSYYLLATNHVVCRLFGSISSPVKIGVIKENF